MSFDLLWDVYGLTETTVNSEPEDQTEALLYEAVPGQFLRLSGQTRFTAAAVGVALSHLIGLEMRVGITEHCRLRNPRTKEGLAIPAQPEYYDVKYVNWGRRGHHLELAVEAILVP
jgi:hypothetical protein